MCERFAAITAVIVQYGNWASTRDCLGSLLRSALKPRQIILVDNASPDGALAEARLWLDKVNLDRDPIPDIKIIALPFNGGYAAGNNAGIRLALAAGAEAVLLLNNDTLLDPGALDAMRRTLASAQRPGLCGPMLIYADDQQLVQCCAGGHTDYLTGISRICGSGMTVEQARHLLPEQVEKEINYICGACVLASREFIEGVGLMDEGYFLYCEEQDWALSAAGRFDLSYAPDAIVYHQEGASTGWNRHKLSLRQAARLARSRIRLAWKHHPWFVPFVGVCSCWAMLRKYARAMIASQ